tara:strand:- start:1440 stop:1622 length:183 start_codon:yes stop_codon:yes gene_type:complete
MSSRVTQLMQLLEEAKEKGDADKVKEIESDLFKERRAKGGEIEEAEVVLVKGGGYTSDLL